MKRIIVAGGNIAGTIIANRLADYLRDEIKRKDVKITVLNPRETHIYFPGLLLIPFGVETPDTVIRKEKDLLNPRIEFLHGDKGTITKIDSANHTVHIADGIAHVYDYLVIATGLEYAWNAIPGYESVHSVYEMDRAVNLREALRGFQGGTIVINTARFPIRCPVALMEITLLLDDYLRKKGIGNNTKIIYTTPIPGIFGRPVANKFITPIFEKRGIEVNSPFTVSSVNPSERTIESQEGDKIKYDLLIGVPVQRGAKVIFDSGIGDRGGWVPTDRYTLKMKGYDNVYVIGDATDLPISKAGSTADYESYVIAHNIANDIKGNLGYREYNGEVFCFIALGIGQATYIRFNYYVNENPASPSYVNWWGKIMYNRMYWSITARASI